ncbi:hypothetical protein CIPAW_10G087500 [Carya illinoinensis]|uniref:Uncharacterized protein n=1 Tax=Carya illinoinensis TaxID=32201 RepID=A0A8T1PCG5_CARIL|nr:hypothetical protein CIPAW_10G087500 [Carya illinoinensis]
MEARSFEWGLYGKANHQLGKSAPLLGSKSRLCDFPPPRPLLHSLLADFKSLLLFPSKYRPQLFFVGQGIGGGDPLRFLGDSHACTTARKLKKPI